MSDSVERPLLAAAWHRLRGGLSGAFAAITGGNIPWIGNVAGLIGIFSALGAATFYLVSLLSAPETAQPAPDAPTVWADAAQLLRAAPQVPDGPDRWPGSGSAPPRADATAARLERPVDRSPARPVAAVAPHDRGGPRDIATPRPKALKLTQGIPRSFPRLPYTVQSCSGGPQVQIDRSDLDSASRGALKVFDTVAETLPVKVADNCWIRAISYTNTNRHNTGGTITFSREDTSP